MSKHYKLKRFIFYDIHKVLGLWFFLLWLRPKFHFIDEQAKLDYKKYKHKGGLILACNHTCFGDPCYANVTYPLRREFILSAEDLPLKPILKWLIKRFLGIFVNRTKLDISSFKDIVYALKEEHIVTIFAEGHINDKIGTIEDFKEGPIVFASAAGVNILPIYYYKEKGFFNRLHIGVGSLVNVEKKKYSKEEVSSLTNDLCAKEKEVMNKVLKEIK